MTGHVRRDPRRWRRHAALAAQPAGAPEALPAPPRRRDPDPADRRPHRPAAARRRPLLRDRPPLRPARPRPDPGRRADRRAQRPQHRRGDRPRHASRSTGPTTRSCSSCRPTSRIEREDVFRDVVSAAGIAWRTARSASMTPLVTLGIQPDRPADRLRLPPARHDARRRRPGRPGLPAARVRGEAEPSAGARADQPAGRRLERRHVRLAAAGDPGRDREVHAR